MLFFVVTIFVVVLGGVDNKGKPGFSFVYQTIVPRCVCFVLFFQTGSFWGYVFQAVGLCLARTGSSLILLLEVLQPQVNRTSLSQIYLSNPTPPTPPVPHCSIYCLIATIKMPLAKCTDWQYSAEMYNALPFFIYLIFFFGTSISDAVIFIAAHLRNTSALLY